MGKKKRRERRPAVVPSRFKDSLRRLPPSLFSSPSRSSSPPPLTYARIDRFYFTAPLFSFNSYPGLIAFSDRRRRCGVL